MTIFSILYKSFLTLTVVTAVFILAAQAQKQNSQPHLNIKGQIVDTLQHPLPSVAVILHHANDSSIVSGSITDTAGFFRFYGLKKGKYFIAIHALGYTSYSSHVINIDDTRQLLSFGNIYLRPVNTQLKTIIVAAARPIIKFEMDRMVMDVAHSPFANGENLSDVLRAIPGVIVNNKGQITIDGRAGVTIQLDGKKLPLTPETLQAFLNSTASNTISSIEVITHPSAKYDAQTPAVINIIRKMPDNKGYYGDLYAGYKQGNYPLLNGSLALNARLNKVAFYLNYNYYFGYDIDKTNQIRRFKISPDDWLYYHDEYLDKRRENGHFSMAGINWQISPKQSAGISLTGTYSPDKHSYNGLTNISSQINSLPDSSYTTQNYYTNTNKMLDANLHYKMNLDSLGRSLEFNYDYLRNITEQAGTYQSYYYDAEKNPLHTPTLLSNNQPLNITIHTFALDYNHHFKSGLLLQAGAKVDLTNMNNQVTYFRNINGQTNIDSSLTNNFQYKERMTAVYISGRKEWKKWGLQIGIRPENTYTYGLSRKNTVPSTNDYWQIQPNLLIQYEPDKFNSFTASWREHSSYPNFNSLNPFVNYIDVHTLTKGNENLKPAVINKYGLEYRYKRYRLSLSYDHIKDMIPVIPLQIQIDSSLQTVGYYQNITTANSFYANLSLPFQINPKWMLIFNMNWNYNIYHFNIQQEAFNRDASSFRISFFSNYQIGKSFDISANGFYLPIYNWLQGHLNGKEELSISVKKSFKNGKYTIKSGIEDLFNTNRERGYINLGGQYTTYNSFYDYRRFTLSFSYNFNRGKQFRIEKGGKNSTEQSRLKNN